MFRGPTVGRPIPAAGPVPSPLLNDVAARATSTPSTTRGAVETTTLTAPIQMCSNPSSFGAILERHKAVIVFFTSQTCPPCKMVEPTFEELAHTKASSHVAFVKVDMGVGMGGMVGEGLGVRATPTFVLFLDGKKVSDLVIHSNCH
jgi:desumoylating isopeptidase 1